MNIYTDQIIYFIRLLISNISVYYCFEKIANKNQNRIRNYIILIIVNLLILPIYIIAIDKFDTFLSFAAMYFLYTMVISKITKTNFGYSLILMITSYAIFVVFHTISVIIQFIPYKILEKTYGFTNMYVSLIVITIILAALLYKFFGIKRFKNGFSFFNNKLNNDITDIIMVNISMLIVVMYCLTGTYYDEITRNLLLTLLIFGAVIVFTIHKMLTMYYKQKLLADTMEEYKKELIEKQNEIDALKQDKKNVSKITHEFYNRQKALELLVASNMNGNNIDKENISPNVLKIIESLTNEYSERFESVKELPKLDKTGIPEIDNMFKYMQSECYNNNINFNLKIMGNIHYLVNNLISKSKLETLIGDHLRDAINAVSLIEGENKEILAILGIKNKKYELSIYDNGVDFTVDTLMKLGIEAVTTNAERGGTGTGFMTTFETLAETKASLIITEYPKTKDNIYTKCVTIRFDGKNQYKIYSYRVKELKIACECNRIKIEEIKTK